MPRPSVVLALAALLAPAFAAADPVFSVGAVSCPEGNPDWSQCQMPIRLSAAPTQRVSVHASTQFIAGGADASDAEPIVDAIIDFDPGDPLTINLVLEIHPDYRIEPDEQLRLVLSNPVNATLGTASADVTLVNDDHAGAISVQAGPFPHAEGIGSVMLTVQRSGLAENVGVNFGFNGTAVAEDYRLEEGYAGTLRFAGGETSKSLEVFIVNDRIDEEDETLELRLSAPTGGAMLANAVGVHRISDDDPVPELWVSDDACTVGEGDTGLRHCDFGLRLSNPSSRAVTLRSRTATLSASGGSDYTSHDWTARSFAAGQTELVVSVPVRGDLQDEANDERFALDFDSPVHLVMPTTRIHGHILDDDDPTGAGLLRFATAANYTGEGQVAQLQVQRTGGRSGAVSVRYLTRNAGALAPVDYTATSGVLHFADGQILQSIAIPVAEDALHESLEGFSVHLEQPTGGAGLHQPGWTGVLIVSDDAAPTLSVDHGGCNVIEGDFGTWACALVLRLSAVSGRAVQFNAWTIDGSATDGIDYIGLPPLATRIPAGDIQAGFVVPVIGDFDVESDETFTLRLRDVTGATPANALDATVRILDDDSADLMFFDQFE